MRSIKNIKKIFENEIYIIISLDDAVKSKEMGFKLLQFGNLKSIFVKEKDFIKIKEV